MLLGGKRRRVLLGGKRRGVLLGGKRSRGGRGEGAVRGKRRRVLLGGGGGIRQPEVVDAHSRGH